MEQTRIITMSMAIFPYGFQLFDYSQNVFMLVMNECIIEIFLQKSTAKTNEKSAKLLKFEYWP